MRHACRQIAKPLPGFSGRRKQTFLSGSFFLVHLFESAAYFLVVTFDGRKRLVGNALGQQRRCCAEQAVTDADVVIEEGKRLPGFDGFKPQADAAEFGCHTRVSTF